MNHFCFFYLVTLYLFVIAANSSCSCPLGEFADLENNVKYHDIPLDESTSQSEPSVITVVDEYSRIHTLPYGATFTGNQTEEKTGFFVSAAGDFNGDGYDDILIGAPYADGLGVEASGEAYLIFGTDAGLPNNTILADISPSTGIIFYGADTHHHLSYSMAAVGDVNGDGYDDILLASPGENAQGANQTGVLYLVFGSTSWVSPVKMTNTTLNGQNGIRLIGNNSHDFAGWSCSGAGDFNGDGKLDIIIGAPNAFAAGHNYAGHAYLVYGHGNSTWPNPIQLKSLDGTNGVIFTGDAPSSWVGYAVSAAGDANKDFFYDDILVGSPGDVFFSGSAYLVHGASNWQSPFVLSTVNGQNGVHFIGLTYYDFFGSSLAHTGDVNGDTVDDFLIGARFANTPNGLDSGAAYLLFGHKTSGTPWTSPYYVKDLDGNNGVQFYGTNQSDFAGYHIDGAGDVDNDGYKDIIIGSLSANQEEQVDVGKVYLIFGMSGNGTKHWANPVNLQDIHSNHHTPGSNIPFGYNYQGAHPHDLAGYTVSAAGDFNNDSFADFLIGAPGVDVPGVGANTGATYLISFECGLGSQVLPNHQCEECLAGTFNDKVNNSCSPCPTGTFNNKVKQVKCTKCHPGYFNDDVGRTACFWCTPGTYSSNYASTNCTQCTIGFYTSAHASTTCLPCVGGTFTDSLGSTHCASCPAGTKSALNSGSSSCIKCPPNTYSPGTTSTCMTCPSGTVVNPTQSGCQDSGGGNGPKNPGEEKPDPTGTIIIIISIVVGLAGIAFFLHRSGRINLFRKFHSYSNIPETPSYTGDTMNSQSGMVEL